MLNFSTSNVNGVGAGSVQKLQKLKHHICTSEQPLTFIQELKVKTLSIAFRDIFCEPQFTVFHTHVCQGAAIIVNNFRLPNAKFSINFTQSNSASTIHQMLEIVDELGISNKFSHIYQSPSLPVPDRLFTEFDDFDPDFVLGDPNLTVHGKVFNEWLNRGNSLFSQNLINFKTFQCHRKKTMVTTPDAIFPKTEHLPSVEVFDSGVVYSDHVRIDVKFNSKLKVPESNQTPASKSPQKYNFTNNQSKIHKIWDDLPQNPNLFHVRQSLQKIAEISKIKSTPKLTPKTAIPAASNDLAVQQINKKYQDFTKKVNIAKDLGKVWTFIRKNQKDPSCSPKTVKIARNKQKKSYAVLKLKLNRDRTLPLTKIQHDKAQKVRRILSRYANYYKKLRFEDVAFKKAELSVVLDGLNTGSSAGPDGTTWPAFPEKSSKNWDKILHGINDKLFNSSRIGLPPWCKQARLVQVPKPDGSGKLRPISILNFLACIIDRLKQSRLDSLIHADPKLRNRLGFIRKRNCEDVVGSLLGEIDRDKKRSFLACLLQLDLSAAYDLVSFANLIIALDIFLRRNKAHRTHPHLLLFVHDWCQNRKIIFENTFFQPANGLPQGAPLSCSLFVIVFNYFPQKSTSKDIHISAYFFCDDISIYISAKTLELLQKTAESIISNFESWCENNSMILNLSKSKVLWFCSTELDIGGIIESADSVRVLGVIFDRKLTFAKHVSSIVEYCKKYNSPLFYLRKMGLNDHLARQFVLGVRSKFTFGLYWHAKIAQTHQNTLETYWTNILRTWLGARRALSRTFVFEAAGLPKIRNFSTYLLFKRSFFQTQKNLEFYPVTSITNALESTTRTRTRTHEFDRNVRSTTIAKTAETDVEIGKREHGFASTWLINTLISNQKLTNILKTNEDWQDKSVRLALGAWSVKLKFLMSKSQRLEVFERETPVFPQNIQISAI